MGIFFHLLYHQFAWAYDWVADIVSLGRWKKWIFTLIPYLGTSNVLELGPGPGHLQLALKGESLTGIGIDSSPQMIGIAAKRLINHDYPPNLVIGQSQYLPFVSGFFEQVLATFPSNFIVDKKTLHEVWRVLISSGELIVIPAAWITGRAPLEMFAAWLFRITGQVPSDKVEDLDEGQFSSFIDREGLGFNLKTEIVDLESSQVLVIRAEKIMKNMNE